jgi:hypothetical protein
MPNCFNDNDGLQTYFHVCFIEKWDSLYKEPEERAGLKEVLATDDDLALWCGDILDLAAPNMCRAMYDAILNSVDWDDLLEDLKEYVKEDETAETM